MLKNSSHILNRILFFIICIYPVQLCADELDELVKTSKEIIKNYAVSMQLAYENAYRQNDPIFVKEVCKKTAKEFASNLGKSGWSIRRINLDYKNIDNAPDLMEKRILNDFVAKQHKGKDINDLAWYKLAEIGNQSEFRYIKAFSLDKRCMECHSNQNNGISTAMAAYSVKKMETKNYFPDETKHPSHIPLPEFKE